MTEILFIVEEDHEGYHAKAVDASIATQGETREKLVENVREAVLCHFNSESAPKLAHLHYVHDETIAIGGSVQAPHGLPDVVEQLRGSILKDDDPFGPATSPEDWEAMR